MPGQRGSHLGNQLTHGFRRPGVEAIVASDLLGDGARRHWRAGSPQRVENGSAELPMAEMRGRLALDLGADRLRRERWIEHADGAVDGFKIGAQLDDALFDLAQLAVEFGALGAKSGDYVRFGHA